MKKLALLAGLGMILFSCAPKTENNEAHLAVVQNYVKAVESLDYNAMSEYLDDNYLGMGPSFGDSINKAQAVESWKNNAENLYKKIEHTKSRFAFVNIPDGNAQGDWIASWSELKITYKNEQTIMIWANSNYLVNNGKIVRSLTFYNEADAFRQLGYEFYIPE
jgi:hypothetical protein